VQISVNVLGRGGAECAIACLTHLRYRLPEGTRVRWLDREDAGAREAVARAFPSVEVIPLDPGLGFAGAHNLGLRRAFAACDDAVMLLAADARPVAGFLLPLREVMKLRPRAAFVSPKVLRRDDPGVLWYAGGEIDWWRGRAATRGAGTPDDGRFDRPGPTDFATGVAMLVRRQAYDRAGPMDASWASPLHDVDWSVRARSVGMEVHYQPRARVLYDRPGNVPRMRPERGQAPAMHHELGQAPEMRPEPAPPETARPGGLRRDRLRLLASHGRWYHWSAAAPRVAAEATGEILRGWRRRELPGRPDPASPIAPAGPAIGADPVPEGRGGPRPR